MKTALSLLTLAGMAASASAQITGVALGTAAPPASFPGVCSLTAFPLEGFHGHTYQPHTSLQSPRGGYMLLSPTHGEARIGQGWATWSHGYTSDIYWTQGATSSTYTMPYDTRGFVLYIEPNPFVVHTIAATGTFAGGNTVTVTQDVDGNGGAKGFGFYSSTDDLAKIDVSSDVDYAVGEFSICQAPLACFADCTDDGTLTIADFACFQNAFALGIMADADCAADGRLNIQDFTCFQNGFALGCP